MPCSCSLWWFISSAEMAPTPEMQEWVTLGLLALTIGVLWPLNAWDFPTYLLLARSWPRAPGAWSGWIHGRAGAAGGGLAHCARHRRWVVCSSTLSSSISPMRTVAWSWWQGSQTPLTALLTVHGFFLFVLATYVVVALRRGPSLLGRLDGDRGGRTPAGVTGWRSPDGGPKRYCWRWLPGAGVAHPPASRSPAEQLLSVLILLGAGLSLGVEHLVLTGDIGRMNTVFKSYLQVWVLWAVATTAALAETLRLWPQGRLASPWNRLGCAVVLLLMATCSTHSWPRQRGSRIVSILRLARASTAKRSCGGRSWRTRGATSRYAGMPRPCAGCGRRSPGVLSSWKRALHPTGGVLG